jgi:hypothetical protein
MLGLGSPGFEFGQGEEIFSSNRPYGPCDPPNFIFSG